MKKAIYVTFGISAFFICLVIFTLIFNATAIANKYSSLEQLEKIKPLKSSEKDVEKLLGKAKERYADVGKYENKEGIFVIKYSEGRCKSTITPKYNVDKDIVITIAFRPKREIIFKSLNIDLSKFSSEETDDVMPIITTYDNLDIGIDYTVQKGILTYIKIYPSNDFSYLECL